MRKIGSILFLLILVACHDDEPEPSNLLTVSVIESRDAALFKKTVILYDGEDYLISTYFDSYISSYPFDVLSGYDELKQRAVQDTLTMDTLVMHDYTKYSGDETYTLAYHLEKGSCLVYDKKTQTIIKTIQMEKWSTGGPMTTTAGRRFYIKGKLFLETVDMMS